MRMMDTATVVELVNAARLGSPEARDALVRDHQREIVVLIAALVYDAAEAEDLAQESFIRAFRNLDLLVDSSRFGAWLRRIAVGVSIDWLRAFRPALYRGWTDTDDEAVASREASPLDTLLRAELVGRVRAALDALPPRYRVPLRLYHLDGLSHAKIAATLDVPIGTVRSLVARARRKLVPLLDDYAPGIAPHVQEVLEEHVTHSVANPFLHVANGTCTTQLIAAASIPGARSIWADVLYEGPVPGGLTDAELMDVRARFHEGVPGSPENDMRQWRVVIENHASYEELILWFEHDLFDQLNLIHLLSWIRERVPPTKQTSLVCIGSFPGRPNFMGLGQLNPDELASLLETRQSLGDAQFAVAERAWQAFREPTPEALDRLRREDTSALPYLGDAITRFLQEYPWTSDGLSRTERHLFELADGSGISLMAAFRRMSEGEKVYYITDSSLAEMATHLSHTTPPLLTLDAASADPRDVLRGAIALTQAGRSVLTGQSDKVAVCGIDRWLGGVHLHGGEAMWRWDDASDRMVRPA